MAAQLIPVRAWAAAVFGEHTPHRNTLLSWIKNGHIRPFPKKVGRRYFCRPDAEYVDHRADRINRMSNGG